MQSCSSAPSVLILLLMIFITGSESDVPVVKVEYGGTAVLPCTERCSGVVSWTPSHKSRDILAECDQNSCRSVKEGYQMIYNQYLQGNLSLIISKADFSKGGRYTCDCAGTDKCDVELQIEGSESAPHVVKVKYGGTAVLPCTEKCSGVVSWIPSDKSTDILAVCDQTSCRSVKEGYQMIYNQYLKGDFSLIITEADSSKRGRYTCDCDGTDTCNDKLQIEALKTPLQIKPGDSLVMKLDVSDPVEVMYYSTGSADGSSGQICTVDKGSMQCEPEYKHRTSLSSSVLKLRDMKESDSGVYIIRDTENKEDIHIYTVTVNSKDSSIPAWTIVLIVLVVLVALVLLVLLVVCVVPSKREITKIYKKCQEVNMPLESNNEKLEKQMNDKVAKNQGNEDEIQEQEKQINIQVAKNQGNEDEIQELECKIQK